MAATDDAIEWACGLDALIEREDGWQPAGAVGDRTPDGVQDVLARMRRDAPHTER